MKRTVKSMGSGWVRVDVEGRSAAGGNVDMTVTFRRKRVRCCGREFVVASETILPFWVDSSYGDVKPRPIQCHNCGTLHGADYWVHR